MKRIYPYFSQNPLDRLDYLRADNQKILDHMDSLNSLFLIFNESNIFINEKTKETFFSKTVIDEYNIDKKEVVFLGEFEGKLYFAFTLKDDINTKLTKVSLREFVTSDYLPESMFGILAQGSAILSWLNSHKFCSFCGKETIVTRAGWRRDCLSCKKEHFPRVDTAVIMLVTFEDYCLLGRGVNFKANRYSCLAGYVESGESFEEAAKRELYEEAGVEGFDVEYLLSQPWPFPSTLMVGMRMKAKSKKLDIDKNEIEDALWVHKDDIKAILNKEKEFSFDIPDKRAIARNLLEIWISE